LFCDVLPTCTPRQADRERERAILMLIEEVLDAGWSRKRAIDPHFPHLISSPPPPDSLKCFNIRVSDLIWAEAGEAEEEDGNGMMRKSEEFNVRLSPLLL